MLGDGVTFAIHNFGGKQSMLSKIKQRLRGYARWMPPDFRIVILLDEDRQDCAELKSQVCKDIEESGLTHKAVVADGEPFHCAVRVAVEEIEAWFFGDCDAIRAAYPKVSPTLEEKAPFRDPDAIAGGTWEQLERVLQRVGYYRTGMPKVEVAASIGEHMSIWANRSRSFQVFRDLMVGF
jgi:hypothetical protein